MTEEFGATIDRLAADTGFDGVVRVDDGDQNVFARAYGHADRAHRIVNTTDTRFAIASGSKALTALMVVRLIEDGHLTLATTARSLLGTDLPLIAADVTVEHLLSHRSGIGDYLDEALIDDLTDHVMTAPVHTLATTDGFLADLGGHATVFTAGERFAYCNGGYIVLALMAERATNRGFHDLVRTLVTEPPGMAHTEFLRTDGLPGDAAIGYVHAADHRDHLRTNVLHMPVRGNGDGGAYTTAADVHALWSALFAGQIVAPEWVAAMTEPRSDVPAERMRYGMGFWLHATGPAVILEGSDPGVSFRTVHHRAGRRTHTVMSNSTAGAWPIARHLAQVLVS